MKPIRREIKKSYSVRVKPSEYKILKEIYGTLGHAIDKLIERVKYSKGWFLSELLNMEVNLVLFAGCGAGFVIGFTFACWFYKLD